MQHRTIRYCIQGKVRNQARMRDVSSSIQPYHTLEYEEDNRRTKRGIRWTLFSFLEDVHFADDVALLSGTRHDMQEKTNTLNDISQKLRLKINKKKSKVMGLNQRNLVSVYLDYEELQTTDNFTYLGSKVCKYGGADVDIKNRMNKARGAFFRLKPVWRSTIYSRITKLRLYQSCVLCTLLHGSQCWRVTKLDTFLPSTQNAFEYLENILATNKSQTTNC